MRIATYNVEWFANLFSEEGKLLDDMQWSGRQDVTRGQQIAALTHVFRAMDADAILVIEAPDSSRHRNGDQALETFAAHAGIRGVCGVIVEFFRKPDDHIGFLAGGATMGMMLSVPMIAVGLAMYVMFAVVGG